MSDIDWSRLRSITARQIISALNRDGFSLRNQSGSHQRTARLSIAIAPATDQT